MISVNKTLLAMALTGVAFAGHAASLVGTGATASADISFAQNGGTTNTLTASSGLLAGNTVDGTVLATGKVGSIHGEAQQYEVDMQSLEGGDIQTSYNGQDLMSVTLLGKASEKNELDVAIYSPEASIKNAVNSVGTVINTTPAESADYQIIALEHNNQGKQSVPADTYTVSTISYVWTE